MRWVYADPPYPGLAKRYYSDHPDYGGEVDHAELLSRLEDWDAWALSTSSRSLPWILSLCDERGLPVRVAAWFRGPRPAKSGAPLQSWEPVVYRGGRQIVRLRTTGDALIHRSRPRTTDPDRVIGAKPAAFFYWLFDLVQALPGDDFTDLFPGSGGGSRAWARYVEASREYSTDGSAPGRGFMIERRNHPCPSRGNRRAAGGRRRGRHSNRAPATRETRGGGPT